MSTYDEVVNGMNPDLATRILEVAVQHNAWEPAVAGTAISAIEDEVKIHDAKDLCRIASSAFNQGVRSEAVIGILTVAGISMEGQPPAQPPAAEQPPHQPASPPAPPSDDGMTTLYNHQTRETQQFPAPAVQPMLNSGWSMEPPPAPAPPATPPPVEQAAGDGASRAGELDINSIIPDYDSKKATEIVEAMKGLTSQEQVDAVKRYEAEEGEDRKTIRNFKWDPPAPPQQPQTVPPPAADVPVHEDDLSDTEHLKAAYHRGDVGHQTSVRERLTPPQEIDFGEPIVPLDLSEVGPGELSNLHTRFHALDVRAMYLMSIEEARAMACRRIAEDEWGAVFEEKWEQAKVALGDNPSASALDSARSTVKLQTEHDDRVVGWRNRVARHEIEARGLAGRQKGYEKTVARLSREQSRREAQAQGAGR